MKKIRLHPNMRLKLLTLYLNPEYRDEKKDKELGIKPMGQVVNVPLYYEEESNLLFTKKKGASNIAADYYTVDMFMPHSAIELIKAIEEWKRNKELMHLFD